MVNESLSISVPLTKEAYQPMEVRLDGEIMVLREDV